MENEQEIESEIAAKGANVAPRITPQHIDDQITCEYIGRASDLFAGAPMVDAMKCLTVCVLVLKNGFTIVGKSACASIENYNAEIGAKIARDDARKQIWALEGYHLRHLLSEPNALQLGAAARAAGIVN